MNKKDFEIQKLKQENEYLKKALKNSQEQRDLLLEILKIDITLLQIKDDRIDDLETNLDLLQLI